MAVFNMYRIIKLVTVVLFFILVYFCLLNLEYSKKVLSIAKPDLNVLNSVIRKDHKQTSTSSEVKKILQNTPYLWRKLKSDRGRIETQKSWIRQLSSVNFTEAVKTKKILVSDDISLYYGTKGRMQCPFAPRFEQRCIVVTLPSEVLRTNASALLEFIVENKIDAVTEIGKYEPKQPPLLPLLPPNVKHILYIWEPPHIAKFANLGRNNAIVASYSRESDIPTPYRRWVEFPEGSPEIKLMNNFDGILGSKKKMVAAMISNCEKTQNNRLEFISELQKYIDVDVYGKCGNFSCSKTNHIECMSMFEKDYKFYLAIENSNCVDYITEKFFNNGLDYNIIPIVMGAPLNTYKAVGPHNSFIHVEEFESPKGLAEYLHEVSRNETLYKQYLEYKGTGYVSNEPHEDFFCRVCGMLYYSTYVPPPKWDSNVTMWKDVNYCLPEGEYYWNDRELF